MKMQFIFGVGGVCGLESKLTRQIAKFFEYIMAIMAMVLLIQWHFEIRGAITPQLDYVLSWIIWGYFVVQASLFLLLVEERLRYLRQNWFLFAVILIGIPQILQVPGSIGLYNVLKPFLALILFLPWFGLIKRSLTDNRLLTTLITVFFTIIIAGILISGIDPGIKSPIDGIWWAWVTMSTVGYGDYAPVTAVGRIFGSVIILLGLCFFAILTANFSSMFVRRDVSKAKAKERQEIKRIIEHIDGIEARDEKILQVLQSIDKRLRALEEK